MVDTERKDRLNIFELNDKDYCDVRSEEKKMNGPIFLALMTGTITILTAGLLIQLGMREFLT